MTDTNPETLTDADLNAEIAAAPPGTFVALTNLKNLGILDVPRAVNNYIEGAARAKAAMAHGFFIEVINLCVQHAELLLRILVVHEKGNGYVIPAGDKRTFGQIIEECSGTMPTALVDRLRDFNRSRIEAVHKYLLGGTDYAALKQACSKSKGLDRDVYEYVIAKVGRPITSVHGVPGEIVVKRGA